LSAFLETVSLGNGSNAMLGAFDLISAIASVDGSFEHLARLFRPALKGQ
jgi:hypothetical protein